jgi:hypothetical protein
MWFKDEENEDFEAENLTDLARIINAKNNTDKINKIIEQNESKNNRNS